MRTLVDSPWFAALTTVTALAAGAVVFAVPAAGGWPLLAVAVLWLPVALSGQWPLPRTPLLAWMALFVAAGVVGARNGFNSAEAHAKLWLMVSAAATGLTLLRSARRAPWTVMTMLALLSPAAAAYYFLTHDWTALPAKVALFDQIGRRWMALRPDLGLPANHPNIMAGIMAIFLPLLVAVAVQARRSRRVVGLLVMVPALLLSVLGVVMATSRGAWVALALTLALWLAWRWSGYVASATRLSAATVMTIVVLVVGVQAVVFLFVVPGGVIGLLDRLPGPPNAGSRLHLLESSLSLLRTYWPVGAGLATFPGLYSYYIKISPFFLLTHAHNLYLAIWLELGVAGFVALLGTVLTTVRALQRGRPVDGMDSAESILLRTALAAALSVTLLHSVVDDVLFASGGLLFFFAVPATAVGQFARRRRRRPWRRTAPVLAVLAAAMLVAVALPPSRAFLAAAWDANRTAVALAHTELTGFGPGSRTRWDEGHNRAEMVAHAPAFAAVLTHRPDSVTAHLHLGRIAMVERDFTTAIAHLEQARAAAPGHPGVTQLLGYAALWAGDLDQAQQWLRADEQTTRELNAYARIWRAEGRADLAEQAARAINRLRRSPSD